MKSVTISALKAHLSANLQLVRNGEDVIIRDRNTPIARIIPFASEDYTEQQRRLIAKGILIPPERRRRVGDKTPWPNPPGKNIISDEVMQQVWREERDER